MSHDEGYDEKRRYFLTRLLPGCALACAGCGTAHAVAPESQVAKAAPPPVLPYGHKFDMPYDAQMTVRQYYKAKYEEMVQFLQALSLDMGKSNLLDMVRTYSEEKSLVLGNAHAEKAAVNDFATWVGMFRDPAYQKLMTLEIVEDAPAAFGMRITECIWATTFQELNAADLGYLLVCHADHTWAEGFNPGIRLTRDKTLMQGHGLCNHRYTWEG